MAEERTEPQPIPYRQLFPWLTLFRAFRIALDAKKLLLAAAGVVVTAAGYGLIWRVGLVSEEDVAGTPALQALYAELEEAPFPGEAALTLTRGWLVRDERAGVPARMPAAVPADFQSGESLPPGGGTPVRRPAPHSLTPMQLATMALRPMRVFVTPFSSLFSLREERSWAHWRQWLATIFSGLWVVAVWAFCGGAISRLAAVQVARDEKPGFSEVIRFARQKYLSFLAAPLFALAFVGVFLIFCFLGGAVVYVFSYWLPLPEVGLAFGGLLWFLPLLAGFVMAIILVGLAVGWPLMLPTISAEGSDSFDALSRSYSYVFQKPWHYLFYALLALAYGAAVIAFVGVFTYLVVYLSGWAVSVGAGREATAVFFSAAPPGTGWNALSGTLFARAPSLDTTRIGSTLSAIWLYVLFLLMIGFTHSYFWTAATVIYFLLRRDVDATDLDEVYLEEEEEEEFGMPPLPEEPEAAVASAPQAAPAETAGGQAANPAEVQEGPAPS